MKTVQTDVQLFNKKFMPKLDKYMTDVGFVAISGDEYGQTWSRPHGTIQHGLKRVLVPFKSSGMNVVKKKDGSYFGFGKLRVSTGRLVAVSLLLNMWRDVEGVLYFTIEHDTAL